MCAMTQAKSSGRLGVNQIWKCNTTSVKWWYEETKAEKAECMILSQTQESSNHPDPGKDLFIATITIPNHLFI